jgi:uncharacterized RDD family membrane protein YckC
MTDAPTPPEANGQPDQPPSYPAPPPAYDATQYGAPATTEFGQPVGATGYPPSAYAHWGQRVAARLLDSLFALPFVVIVIVGVVIVSANTRTTIDSTGYQTTSLESGAALGFVIIGLGYLAILVFEIWNTIFRQGRTGWSLGKKAMGIRLLDEQTGQPMGAGMCFVRQLAHILDGLACYIGYLWPLWDDKRQTFADKLTHTVVIPAAEPRK